MGRAVLRLNAYALCRMILPVDGAKAMALSFEPDPEGGPVPVLVAVIEGESIPDTDDLAVEFREIAGIRMNDGRRGRAYVPRALIANQDPVNSRDSGASHRQPSAKERAAHE